MSQPPNTRLSRPASGTNSLIAGDRASVRLPRRTVPICVSEPMGFARPFLIAMMPAMVVVDTAPRPTRSRPTLPPAGAMDKPSDTGENYIIRVLARLRSVSELRRRQAFGQSSGKASDAELQRDSRQWRDREAVPAGRLTTSNRAGDGRRQSRKRRHHHRRGGPGPFGGGRARHRAQRTHAHRRGVGRRAAASRSGRDQCRRA